MKLMITGAKGQLGQDMMKECQRRQIEFIASDLPELDISDLAGVQAAVRAAKPDAIVNCSAYNAVDRAETDFQQACLVNGIGPKNLAIAAEEAGIVVMHFSTDFVFDGRKTEPYTIADTPRPLGRYGQSKRLGEQLLQAATNRFYLIRLSWVFGAGNDNFAKKVLQWAKGRDELRVVEDQVSCPAYTVDLAPTILDLLDTGAYGLYHLANSGFCSRYEWARHIIETAGLKVKVLPARSDEFPVPAPRPAFSAMDPFPIPLLIGRELPSWQDATERFLQEIGASA